MKTAFNDTFGDFKCIHCRTMVSADPRFSGVNNRNHCPYCLWSKHLDLHEAGDRLCACKSPMQPVGLTMKQARKKYASAKQGELMIIHHCTDCGRISINRIAADDIVEKVLEIFELGQRLDAATAQRLRQDGVRLLTAADRDLVHARLFGWGSSIHEFQAAFAQEADLLASWAE